jgi:hemerythrin superfamily protein
LEKVKSTLGLGETQGSIYEILKSEHRQIKQKFQEVINSRNMNLFSLTLNALTLHMNGEESIFYPKLEANSNTRMLALKAFEEHRVGKDLAGRITSTQADDRWLAQVEVLFDIVVHHVDFEETQIFPAAKYLISENDAMELGKTYRSTSQSQTKITATM